MPVSKFLRLSAAALCAAGIFCAAAAFAAQSPAPDFTVEDKDGVPFSLSNFTGTPVVVNFWATWCPPCRAELPAFDSAASMYDNKVQFMMVDLTDGQRETVKKALAFIEENAYTFPVYFDTKLEAASRYGIRSIPTTVIVDAEGNIADVHIGAMDDATLRRYIEKVIVKD